MKFEIQAEKNATDKKVFIYDNMSNTLSGPDGLIYEYTEIPEDTRPDAVPFDRDNPLRKSRAVQLIKIQMGLSCNYTCDYCSQKFIERPPETSKKDIDDFLAKFDTLEFDEKRGLKIEFWGGEPLVYWKTLKPLAEAIKERFQHWEKEPRFSMITNGSILTKEMCAWLYYMGFSVSISHDGPGQHLRGPDPFEDPKQKRIILDFYKIMRRQSRISFNSMLSNGNMSRKKIHQWFVDLTGDEDVPLGEGGIIDAYDDDGAGNSLNSLADHFEFRRTAFTDIFANDGNIGFKVILDKVDNFTRDVLSHKHADKLNQKCGMDMPGVMAIDLRGNVITCQNVSAAETAMNGTPHLGGNITDIENVKLHAGTHWKNRPACAECPVLHVCKGACLFLADKYWDISCNNAYSEHVASFALSIEKITGYIPTLIKPIDGELPLDRQDIWGTIYEHKEPEKKRIISIKVVSEKIGAIDDVEVYGKARVEQL